MAHNGLVQGRVVVVGAGAAGIIAAWRACSLGAKVTLLEKTPRLGTKILISGGGKCNVTHDGPVESVLRAFRSKEAAFLRPSFYRWPPSGIIRLLGDGGLTLYTRPDGRMFPVDKDAKDVVACLATLLDGVDVRLSCPVHSVVADHDGVSRVMTQTGAIETRHVVLCVGGSSYPKSGTTGDGYAWAESLGHRVAPVRAALAPVELAGVTGDPRAGVAIRDVVLRARQGTKVIDKWRGDVLFTHRGLSGPTVLAITRTIAERWEQGRVSLESDLAPDTSFEELQADLMRWKADFPSRKVGKVLEEFVPERLVNGLLQSAGIEPTATGQTLGKKDANRLVAVLKGWPLGEVSRVPLEAGECVAGGVALDEVDPRSMRSCKVSGLYLAGEILDVAGPVGGYNLQAAWSTGYVAGDAAAQDWSATS